MRKLKLLLAAAVVAVGGFAGTSVLTDAPEKADAAILCNYRVKHPTDNSWSCASGPAGWYRACDYHVDGHRVRAWIDTVEPTPDPSKPDRISAWAPSKGCTEWAGVQYGGIYILRIKTCTEKEGCSAWKKVG
jgi:hypothetical protein